MRPVNSEVDEAVKRRVRREQAVICARRRNAGVRRSHFIEHIHRQVARTTPEERCAFCRMRKVTALRIADRGA